MSYFCLFLQQAKVALARCHLMMGSWGNALEAAEVVLGEDKRNIKAIYVKAEALFNLCEFEHSLVHFHRGLVNLFRLYANYIVQNTSLFLPLSLPPLHATIL